MNDLELMNAGCVAMNLRRAARIVTRKYEAALRPFALTSFQISLLKALTDHPNAAQSRLAEAFGMDVSTLNRNLVPVVKRGLVVVTPDEKDQRIKRLALTDAGAALFAAALPEWAKVQRHFLETIGPERWPELKGALRTLKD